MAKRLKREQERRLVDMLNDFLLRGEVLPRKAANNTEGWKIFLHSLADRLLARHSQVEKIASELEIAKNKNLARQVRNLQELIDDLTTAAITTAQMIIRLNAENNILRIKIENMEKAARPAKGKSKKR